MPQSRFDLIVFDWDGTLMDSTAHIARSIQAACRALNLPAPADHAARDVIGLGLRQALQKVAPLLPPDEYPKLIEQYRLQYWACEPHIALFEGARELLEALRAQGYLLAVATGKGRAGLTRALNATHLGTLFDATRCAEEAFPKPHPAMLIELMDELGQSPERTVMIGDTTHDLQMAEQAQTARVAVTYGAHPAEALNAAAPLFCAQDMAALADWLYQNG